MIVFKMAVAADKKYFFANLPNCVLFDVHNDTPYNMGVSFGRDTGVDNADYFTSPHSVLTGIGPVGNAPSLGNSRWTGTIYIYTETPLGTGSTDLDTAPAFQITMIGYPVGYQPTGTTSLARMTATPNTVSTNTMSNTTTAVSNTGNPPLTNWLIAQANDLSGTNYTFQADNSGNLAVSSDNAGVLTTLLQLIAGASPAVKIAAAAIVAEVLGDLQVDGNIVMPNNVTFQMKDSGGTARDVLYVDASNLTDLQSAKSGGPINLKNQDGTTWCSFNANGYKGPSGDSLCRVGSCSGTGSGTVSQTVGASPDFMAITVHQSASSATVGYFSESSTQVTVTLGASLTWFGFLTKRS